MFQRQLDDRSATHQLDARDTPVRVEPEQLLKFLLRFRYQLERTLPHSRRSFPLKSANNPILQQSARNLIHLVQVQQ